MTLGFNIIDYNVFDAQQCLHYRHYVFHITVDPMRKNPSLSVRDLG